MIELTQYGIQPQSESQSVVPTEQPPPYLIFASGLDALYDKILNTLMQDKGTLFYDRQLGTDLSSISFESDSPSIENTIKSDIYNALTYAIEDISIDDIVVTKNYTEYGVYYDVEIVVKYTDSSYTLNLTLTNTGWQLE